MQITTQTQFKTLKKSDDSQQPKKTSDKAYKPGVDWWEVNGERYESTSEMLANLPDEGAKASYRFLAKAPDTKKPELGPDLATGALVGGLAGAGLVAGGTVAGAFLGEVLYILTLGFGSQPGPMNLSMKAVGIAAGVGTAVGAGVAAYKNKTFQAPDLKQLASSHTGTIRKEGDKAVFYLNNDLERGVNLTEYANAKELPAEVRPEGEGREGWAKQTGLGFASAAVPLVGLVGPAAAGVDLGGQLAGGKAYGTIIGGAAGVAATAGVIAAGQHGLVPYLGAAAAAGAVGAGLGALLGPAADARAPGVTPGLEEQWWS